MVLAWPATAASRPRLAAEPFRLGIASGSPTAGSVVLWTRLMDASGGPVLHPAPAAVRWEIADDDQFSRLPGRGEVQALPELAKSVHADGVGLDSDGWYFYRFIAGGIASPVGCTRSVSAPDAAPQQLRLAHASCQRWEHGNFSAYRHIWEENLDAVLFPGDYIDQYDSLATFAVQVGRPQLERA